MGAGRLESLTALRFFAALHVALFHALPLLAVVELPRAVVNVLSRGQMGVSFFFVLSGFVLALRYLARGETLDNRAFFVARVARIYPVYLLGLVVAFPILALPDVERSPRNAAAHGVFVLGLLQSWVPRWAELWNAPAWSLSCEAFFYVTFPVLGAWAWGASRRGAVGGIALLWAASLAAPVAVLAWAPGDDASWRVVKVFPMLRLPEFLLGVLAAKLHATRARPVHRATPWLLLGGLFALVALGGLPSDLVDVGLLAPLFAAIILAFAATPLGSAPWLVRFGEASYAFYLLHYATLGWLVRFVGAPSSAAGALLLVVAYLALAVALSLAAHALVERPARAWIQTRFT